MNLRFNKGGRNRLQYLFQLDVAQQYGMRWLHD